MTWNNPVTVGEIASSVQRGFTFRSRPFGLNGHYVAVLSYQGGLENLRSGTDHPLTEHALATAKRYREAYLDNGTRRPHPTDVTYYVADVRTGLAIAIVQADGLVLEEIATQRPTMRSSTREQIIDALHYRALNQESRTS